MKKEFFPNVEYNRKKRSKLLVFYALLVVTSGGFGVYLLASGQSTLAILMLGIVVMFLTMIPSGLAQYPTKLVPLITIENKTARLGPTETFKANEIVAVSVVIEVPAISRVDSENKEFLQKVASTKPSEPILGACDVTVLNNKGKEVIKYAIIDDCIGALEAFLEMGVKKYRILYSQKRNTQEATYTMVAPQGLATEKPVVTEKEKLDQLF